VVCLAIALFGALSLARTRVDVLPSVDIPVVVVVWNYPGLVAEEVEKRVIYLTERALSTTISDIERLDSQSIDSIGLVKIYFHPETEIAAAIAQVTSICNAILRLMPPGITPPAILQFNASNVPVAQLTLSGKGVGEQDLFDYGLNVLRLRLFTVPGLATPAPFGGRQKQVMVDIDPARLAAMGLSPQDVVGAVTSQNVILPAGSARMGEHEYDVQLNGSPLEIPQFDQLPVREVDGRMIRLGDVAHAHEGYGVQTNVAEVERAVRELAGGDVASVVDNLGIPVSYNLGFVQTSNAGGEDAEIRISLRQGHQPSARLAERLRRELPTRFPGAAVWFEPADVVSQVLSFGLPAQLEAEVIGRDVAGAFATAQKVIAAVRLVPGAVDAHIAQVFDRPGAGGGRRPSSRCSSPSAGAISVRWRETSRLRSGAYRSRRASPCGCAGRARACSRPSAGSASGSSSRSRSCTCSSSSCSSRGRTRSSSSWRCPERWSASSGCSPSQGRPSTSSRSWARSWRWGSRPRTASCSSRSRTITAPRRSGIRGRSRRSARRRTRGCGRS